MGPLINHFGDGGPRLLRIPLRASVASVCNGRGWVMPHARSDEAVNLQAFLTTITLPSACHRKYTFGWFVDGVKCMGFSSAKTWSALRPSATKKDGCDAVWFKGATPKNAILMWICQLDRLPTRTRLASWGLQIPTSCCLCNATDETRDHLMLKYSFAENIWFSVKQRIGMRSSVLSSWSALTTWVKGSTNRAPSTLRKNVVQVVVYEIWKQRKNLLHNQQIIPSLTVFRKVNRQVQNTITARKKLKRFTDLMQLWIHALLWLSQYPLQCPPPPPSWLSQYPTCWHLA